MNAIGTGARSVAINEIRIDQPGTDLDEYVELAGIPGASLEGLAYVVIGDGAGGSGVVEAVVDLGALTLSEDGFLLLAEDDDTFGASGIVTDLDFENSDNVTHLLVEGSTAGNGDDLDTDDDGVLDLEPWSHILDSVALVEDRSGGERVYGETTVGPDGSFVPAHVFRAPDASGDFVIGAFDPAAGDDTPGARNVEVAAPPSFALVVTEAWVGQAGDDVTADWFELTNVGERPWVAGVDAALFYDDESEDPGAADPIGGLTRLDPGRSAVVVIDGDPAAIGAFRSVWGPVIDLDGVEIGRTDGAGLGQSGDAVTLFAGGPADETIVDVAPIPASPSGVAFDVVNDRFAEAGVDGAVATVATGGEDGAEPAVGSPGNGEPAPDLAFDLQITEIWPGQDGADLTTDWFEVTNRGNADWVAATAGALFYDDVSADPSEARVVTGIDRLAPGQRAIVLADADAADVAEFVAVWSPVVDLAGVAVGFAFDAAGLGAGGDAVTLYVGDPRTGGRVVDSEAYGDSTANDAQSFDVDLQAFSAPGAPANAVTTLATAGATGDVAAVGSPGDGAPIPTFLSLQVTEIWPGQEGDDVTADWFEITNVGTRAWTPGEGALEYDDESADPSDKTAIVGLAQIAPGERVVVVVGSAADAAEFRTVWGDVLDFSGLQIGVTDGSGLGNGGDAVTLFLDGGLTEFEAYPDATGNSGRSFDVALGAFSTVANASGAVATAVLADGEPAIASPGDREPVVFDPDAPVVTADVAATTGFLDVAGETPRVAGTVDDPSDPAATEGIVLSIADADSELGDLAVTATSSDQSVVADADLTLAGSGAARTLTIEPAGAGAALITVTATDGDGNLGTLTIDYRASAAATTPATSVFHTGNSDASAAVAVDDGFMLVADDEDQGIQLVDRDRSGLPVAVFDFDAELGGGGEVDIEGAVRSGETIFWIGSHETDPRGKLFATTLSGSGAEATLAFAGAYTTLRAELAAWDASDGHGLGADFLFGGGAFNVEGLTLAPGGGGTAYLGFRSPAIDDDALIVPVTNFTTLPAAAPGTAAFGAPIRLDLGGRTIRDLETNGTDIAILAGPSGAARDFALFAWSGDAGDVPMPFASAINRSAVETAGSPEAIVELPEDVGVGTTLQIITDNGDTDWYGDRTASKDLPAKPLETFRSDLVTLAAPDAPIVVINEIRIDQPGGDDDEYFELAGTPGLGLDGFSYLVIGDGAGGSGVVEAVVDLTGRTLDAAGFFLAAEDTDTFGAGGFVTDLDFENSDNVTHLLVEGFTGEVGGDLDTDDDGILDAEPWSRVFDSVALIEEVGGGDRVYSAVTVGPDGPFVPGHVFRDPDIDGAFAIGAFDPDDGDDTPGAARAFDLQITETWAGQDGADLTEDWFEITNLGTTPWVAGRSAPLFYDDESSSAADATSIDGLARIDPGEAVVVVIGRADDAAAFRAAWEADITLDDVQIGWSDGAGLGSGGDGVTLFVGGPSAVTIADFETYPAAPSGVSFDVEAGGFSLAGVAGAVATTATAGPGDEPAVGSPGNGAPVAGGVTRISAVQGASDVSPLDGQTVTVEAIVVGDFQDGDADDGRNLRGFYLQEEDADGDGDAATSEGLFVFDGGDASSDVNLGDRVRVTGTVTEFFGETQLGDVGEVVVLDTGNALPTAAEITLPAAATTLSQDGDVQPDLEAFEGMRVTFTDALTVTEMFQLDRFNEIKLSEGGRLEQFTQSNAPSVAGFAAHLEAIGARTITYDDGLNEQNAAIGNLDGFGPTFTTANAVRMGDTITGLSGVLDYKWAGNGASGATWRVRSTENGENSFADGAEPRSTTPDEVGGSLQVASFNVLNYFTTLDDGALTDGGLGPRGADDPAELARQTEKLVTTLISLDADVLGLVELENSVDDTALVTLVDALNTELEATVYDLVATPGLVGTDAITTGIIYKPAAVTPVGDVAILDDPSFLDPNDSGSDRNRPAVMQSFEAGASGEVFSVVVNHFKSKGPSGLEAGDATDPDSDQGDGQGFWNDTRTDAAAALAAWLAGDPTGIGDPDTLILGDLNAYAEEDPIRALEAAGFTDLAELFLGDDAYGFVFDGQRGQLDYALASRSLLGQVTGATEWHINADEADALDYNLDFGRDPAIFDGTVPFRASDHDPVLVGLDLMPALNVVAGDDTGNRLAGTAADDLLDGRGGNDLLQAGAGDDTLLGGTGVNRMLGGDGADLFVLAAAGRQLVYDFDANEDRVGLQGLAFEDLVFVGQNGSTVVESGSGPAATLALFRGVAPATLEDPTLFTPFGDDALIA